MHEISSYRGNRSTAHSHTHRQDRLQYTAPQLARDVKKIYYHQINHIKNQSLLRRFDLKHLLHKLHQKCLLAYTMRFNQHNAV